MNWLFYCVSCLLVGCFGSWVLSSLSLILDLKILRVYGLNSERGVGSLRPRPHGWECRGKHVLGVRFDRYSSPLSGTVNLSIFFFLGSWDTILFCCCSLTKEYFSFLYVLTLFPSAFFVAEAFSLADLRLNGIAWKKVIWWNLYSTLIQNMSRRMENLLHTICVCI